MEFLQELLKETFIYIVLFLIAFISYVIKWLKAKYPNFATCYTIIESLVIQAESLYANGEDKKNFVIEAFKNWSKKNKNAFDEKTVNTIIESLISVSKIVNARNSESNTLKEISDKLKKE